VGADLESLIAQAMSDARTEGRRVLALDTIRPNLEDVFVQLTGLNADVMRSEKSGQAK